MLAGAKQEGTSDVAYSRNQPSVLEDEREPQRQSRARSGAPQTSNPRRIADFRRSQVCDSKILRTSSPPVSLGSNTCPQLADTSTVSDPKITGTNGNAGGSVF